MSKKKDLTVLLYYKIVDVENPTTQTRRMRRICKALDLKGRILIGKDGINGTVAGTEESTQAYRDYCDSHKVFDEMDFKVSYAAKQPFPKMSVKARDEIITTGVRDTFDLKKRASHVTRDEFHQWMKDGEDIVVLDMRNDYEWAIGRFKNSIRPPMKYFRDLDENMEFYNKYKGKKIVTFCTGGIRCEPASAQLVAAGFDRDNLYQLEGGIVKYAEKYGDEGFFEGKCFVFDDRLAVDVDTTDNAVIVGECMHCGNKTEEFYNCLNAKCNLLYLDCKVCAQKFDKTCSKECQEFIQDPSHMRSPRIKVAHRNK